MNSRIEPLTRGTLVTAPSVCRDCVWWQQHRGKSVSKERWIGLAEERWGAWGTVYQDDGGPLAVMQHGPASFFPRARELPGGPASDDAVLVTCAYLIDPASPWVIRSLFLAAIGEARLRGAKALEAFAFHYREEEDFEERFLLHRAIFPHDLLLDLGFVMVRSAGRVRLMRLELGGLEPSVEPERAGFLGALKRLHWPTPVPAPPRP
ncbi:MAG: hypothetical protein ABSC51_10895 [Gaiellaceae bacterium]|jgi:hypothetical protein